jgi:hypothetical protein
MVGIFLAGLLIGSITAAAADRQPERLAESVSPSFLAAISVADIPAVGKLSTCGNIAIPEVIVAIPQRTEADRWSDFEDEYGIHQRNPVWILSLIQSAKLGLDKLTFGAKETARKLEFTYDLGGSEPSGPRSVPERPAYSLPLFGKFGHPQLKSVLTEHDPETAKAFVGLQLYIPFGKGAAER